MSNDNEAQQPRPLTGDEVGRFREATLHMMRVYGFGDVLLYAKAAMRMLATLDRERLENNRLRQANNALARKLNQHSDVPLFWDKERQVRVDYPGPTEYPKEDTDNGH